MAKKFIKGMNLDKGAFTAKANAAGEGVQEYAHNVTKPGSNASPKTKKQAVLAETFAKMAKGKKKITKVEKRK